MVLNSLIIHRLIIITCISYEIVVTKSLPKLINTVPLLTCVICVTDAIRHRNTDNSVYSGAILMRLALIWQIYFHS